MKVGLFIGRFQPLHKGHLAVIQKALKKVDRLLVVIGSAQQKLDARNCFTLAERKKMLHACCPSVQIITLCDYKDNTQWVHELLKKTGHVDVLFCSNALVRELLSKCGMQMFPSTSRYSVHGTIIRKCMVAGKKWEHYVPTNVAALITDKQIRRLRLCSKPFLCSPRQLGTTSYIQD